MIDYPSPLTGVDHANAAGEEAAQVGEEAVKREAPPSPALRSQLLVLRSCACGECLMTAEDYRRKARDFLALARQFTDPHDRAKLVSIAALWNERAENADQRERIVQQQQQAQPDAALFDGRED
jgi:hypothetical protein